MVRKDFHLLEAIHALLSLQQTNEKHPPVNIFKVCRGVENAKAVLGRIFTFSKPYMHSHRYYKLLKNTHLNGGVRKDFHLLKAIFYISRRLSNLSAPAQGDVATKLQLVLNTYKNFQ